MEVGMVEERTAFPTGRPSLGWHLPAMDRHASAALPDGSAVAVRHAPEELATSGALL